MFRLNPFRKKKKGLKNDQVIQNQLEIKIGDVIIRLLRNNTSQPRNELTAIIPRAEIRRKFYNNGHFTAEEEIILNSITLVDAPSHGSEKNQGF